MMRVLFRICLVVALSLTSVTAAVARGQMAGATEMVVCAGTGVATVTLDATGTPIKVHHCPVCTAATFDTSVPGVAVVVWLSARFVTLRADAVNFRKGVDHIASVARGPPATV